MLENLHFLRPLWLLALIPLAWLAWQACRPRDGDNPWQRIVDARLLPLLMIAPTQAVKRSVFGLLALGWFIATLALADPTWERKPQPVLQTQAARVVVLDLSSSMNATDLKPSRLALARYKVEDVLRLAAEGQTGLVVYAGDAYTVTPLTRDVNTIRSQLDALAPDLMPSDGSRADLGLLKAEALLRQAGISNGQVLLIADGVAPDALDATRQAAAQLKRDGYSVSVLAIGAPAGAPAADARGTPVNAAPGQPLPRDTAGLSSIAQAGGGADLSLETGTDGLRGWVDAHGPASAAGTPAPGATAQAWVENGPLLVLLLLPIAALAFRRNWLLSLMLLPMLTMQPHDAKASTWDDLWQRPEQQAARSLSAGDYADAARLASDAERRGSAEYKLGNYPLALADFAQARGPRAAYNRGNTLAKLGLYRDAIAAYDEALQGEPNNADARANKAAVEAMLKRQQDQQKQDQQKQDQQKQPSQEPKSSQGSDSKQDAKSGASGQGGGQGSSGDKAQGGQAGSGQGAQGKSNDQHTSGQTSGQANASQTGASKEPSSSGQGKSASASASKAESKDGGGERQGSASASAAPPAGSGHEFADAARQLAKAGGAEQKPTGDPATDAQPGATADSASSDAKGRPGAASASGHAQPLPTEEQLAAEQWLRRIPDDPGGLLRRKFLYQYRQRERQSPADAP